MSEDAPTLAPSVPELQQWAYAVNALGQLAARIRMRREAAGRLAFADDENAERVHRARQAPPIRSMTDDEQRSWQERAPREVVAQPHGEPFTVWTAQMSDANGVATSEWGLEAHTWEADGRPSASLFVVCRDAADALALTRYLRERPHAVELASLHHLAATTSSPVDAEAPVLGEQEWAAALRRALPARVAERVIVTDPGHAHHAAWRELHQLANQEVARVGADPDRLAALVRTVPSWRDGVRNPPALAHWALTQARTAADYDRVVRSSPTAAAAPTAGASPTTTSARRLRLDEVRSPQQARTWAEKLEAGSAAHRLEAKSGYGRWGEAVDAILLTKFPGLAARSRPTPAVQERHRRPSTAMLVHTAPVERDVASPTLEELAAEVDRLDPDKPIDRRAALTMLGHVPQVIDQRIATKFDGDAAIAQKVQQLYPHGFDAAAAEAEAAAWRNRADADEHAAARARAVPDQPSTPQREDHTGQTVARTEQAEAAAQHGIAHSIAAAPARTPAPPGSAPARRR